MLALVGSIKARDDNDEKAVACAGGNIVRVLCISYSGGRQGDAMGFLKVVFATVLIAVVLFFGSAVVVGIVDSNRNDLDRKLAQKLTGIPELQKMVSSRLDGTAPLACLYLSAISYRLAEARDLGITRSTAIELANNEFLVTELIKNGFNSASVVRGVSSIVYDSPLSPQGSFDAQLDSCVNGRPRY